MCDTAEAHVILETRYGAVRAVARFLSNLHAMDADQSIALHNNPMPTHHASFAVP